MLTFSQTLSCLPTLTCSFFPSSEVLTTSLFSHTGGCRSERIKPRVRPYLWLSARPRLVRGWGWVGGWYADAGRVLAPIHTQDDRLQARQGPADPTRAGSHCGAGWKCSPDHARGGGWVRGVGSPYTALLLLAPTSPFRCPLSEGFC